MRYASAMYVTDLPIPSALCFTVTGCEFKSELLTQAFKRGPLLVQ